MINIITHRVEISERVPPDPSPFLFSFSGGHKQCEERFDFINCLANFALNRLQFPAATNGQLDELTRRPSQDNLVEFLR